MDQTTLAGLAINRCIRRLATITIVVTAFLAVGCGGNQSSSNTASSNAIPAATKTEEDPAARKPKEPILTKEPDRYSETVTIDVQPEVPTAAQDPGKAGKPPAPPLQFEFTRIGANRRAIFQLKSVGQIEYLEHSGLKYLVLPLKKQYSELDIQTTGVTLPQLSLLTPTSVVEHLKSEAKYENLGTEPVNGRSAVKYKFDLTTVPGQPSPATDAVFFLDETTGLPVRAEIVGTSPEGGGSRILMEMRDVQLNPDPASFDIPIGYKKVPAQQVKQQLAALADAMKTIAAALEQQTNPRPSPAPQPSQSASPKPGPSPGPNARGGPLKR